MPDDKLANFMNGFAAATQLLVRAGQNGYFVEYVVLAASVIDATLRIGVILQHQLKSKTPDLLDDLLEQPEESRGYSERTIYKRALQDGVVNQELFDDLEALYDRRNRVIHRYIISRITTDQVLSIATEYERTIPRVSAAIGALEEQQIQKRIGMTVAGPAATPELLDELAAQKHASQALASKLRSDGE